MDKGLLIKFGNKEQMGTILNLWDELNKEWQAINRGIGRSSSVLPNPIIAEDGESYMVIKADTCSVDNVVEVGYDDAWAVLKHCVVNGLK